MKIINLRKVDDDFFIFLSKNHNRPSFIKTNEGLIIMGKKRKGMFKKGKPKKIDKIRLKKKIVKNTVIGNWMDTDEGLWRPKQLIQYVKHRYVVKYSKLPLELDFADEGYTLHSRERLRAWAYGKHLLDKLNRHGIKNKVRNYISWCFETQTRRITPTMALLSCNNWIDQYFFTMSNVSQDNQSNDSEDWDDSIKELSE